MGMCGENVDYYKRRKYLYEIQHNNIKSQGKGYLSESNINFTPNELAKSNIKIKLSNIYGSTFLKSTIKDSLIEIDNTDICASTVLKSICNLQIDTIKNNQSIILNNTGFLLKFYIYQEMFYCLVSNENYITDEIINNNNEINITYDNEFKSITIKLDKNKRYIKTFKDIGLDITIVEILEEDNITKDYFLYSENEERINDDLIDSNIYIPLYPKGEDLKYLKGQIKSINENEFTHFDDIESSSSGNPIILENRIYVLGIQKKRKGEKNENFGDFIFPAVNMVVKDIDEKRNIGKFIDGKYIWDDNKYYIGEYKDNIPNGKGIKYNSNDSIMYEGEFINGKFEGKGKYIYPDGRYYIGEYKNGLRNGKGIIYYSNGKIAFEGEYINDKREGNGKRIYEDGRYFIGQFKNGFASGKGTEYYPNGNIMYEGEYINGKREGKGKYIFNDGKSYIGEWKNGLRNGRGIEYYSFGQIKRKGNWVSDKFVG